MKMTITFDPRDRHEMSDCIGTLRLLMEAAQHDAAIGQQIIDALAPFLLPRVLKVLPDIVQSEGVTTFDELYAVFADPALIKGKYRMGAKSRTEFFSAYARAVNDMQNKPGRTCPNGEGS